MSQADVEIVAAVIDRWNSGEWLVPDAYDPEIEWLPHRSITEGTYHGIEGMRRFAEDTREMFDVFELRCEHLLDAGERVIGWGTVHFRARQSGLESEIPFGGLATIRDGRILRFEDLGSKQAVLEAAGLSG